MSIFEKKKKKCDKLSKCGSRENQCTQVESFLVWTS